MLEISGEEFTQISEIMYEKAGVKLRETKKPLVVSRLRKRLDELHLSNFTQYIKVLSSQNPKEIEYFVNALSTNETYFFRHARHFNYLFEQVLPAFKAEGRGKISVWSAACSKGDEPYSLAISLNEFKEKNGGPDFQIFASDINTEVINEAKEAIYDERSLKDVPASLMSKYFRTRQDGRATVYQVTDSIRRKVEFFQHNLKMPYTQKKDFDVIFLRNVLIYFDRETKQGVVNFLENNLKPSGLFFISLSENLNDIKTGLKLIESGIFRKS